MNDGTVRLAHLSDVHISARPLGWQPRDWFCKRVTGWFNLHCLGRAHHFRAADQVLGALMTELRGERRPDHIVFSGDATALGFPAEMARAAALLGVKDTASPPGIAVPGNHDYYTPAAAAGGCFEQCFGPWLEGERIGTATYPFARRVGSLWLVAVNSSKGNVWPGDASGRVGAEQLDRLRQLLQRLPSGPRILVTHYPVCEAEGQPERASHGLQDVAEVVQVAGAGGVVLWLHGHEHHWYRVHRREVAPFPIVCVGSSTQWGRWGYHEYVIAGTRLQARRRVYNFEHACFGDAETFELSLE